MGLFPPVNKMVHSHGLRAGTRDLFARGFKKNGPTHPSVYLTQYKVGDMVDVKVDSSIHKGMPYKFYHGRTGVVRNVTKRALGVELTKELGNRQLRKRINVRIEHVRKSKCRDDFLNRVKTNDKLKHDAHVAGKGHISTKRTPIMPIKGFSVNLKDQKIITMEPQPFDLADFV